MYLVIISKIIDEQDDLLEKPEKLNTRKDAINYVRNILVKEIENIIRKYNLDDVHLRQKNNWCLDFNNIFEYYYKPYSLKLKNKEYSIQKLIKLIDDSNCGYCITYQIIFKDC